MTKSFDPARAQETSRRLRETIRLLREGKRPRRHTPLISRETMKLPGDLVISSTRTETV